MVLFAIKSENTDEEKTRWLPEKLKYGSIKLDCSPVSPRLAGPSSPGVFGQETQASSQHVSMLAC